MSKMDVIFYVMMFLLGLLIETVGASLSETEMSHEHRLTQDLQKQYERLGRMARPNMNSSLPVNVKFGIRLVHLDLEEKDQVMKTSVWVKLRWKDEYMRWNSSEYGNIKEVTIPHDMIWTPDIVLVNTAETKIKEKPADLRVRDKGMVTWVPQRSYSSACLIDTTEYPYDRHTCDMWFQSVSNHEWNVNITTYGPSPLDLDTYLSSYKHAQEWEILSNSTLWIDTPRDVGMILMYSRRAALRFSLTVQRRPGFKSLLLIVPCALLSLLIPLIFCLPLERPDRHTLAMALFTSLTMLLFMVTEIAPPSAAFVPRLALYYCAVLVELLLATCLSVVVVNLSRRSENRVRVPKWARLLIIKQLGKFLCFGKRLQHLGEVKQASKRVNKPQSTNHQNLTSLENGDDLPSKTSPECFPLQNTCANDDLLKQRDVIVQFNKRLSSIETELMGVTEQKGQKQVLFGADIPPHMGIEWRMLSLVLDRFFFFMFLFTDFILIGVFHPRTSVYVAQ